LHPLQGAPNDRRAQPACHNRTVTSLDDRFDDLIAGLGGFYRAWLVYLGLELGLFARLRDAGPDGLSVAELATATGTRAEAVDVWAWAADAHRLARLEGGRLVLEPVVATILLDDQSPEFLGGQFVHAVVASLDWHRMLDFFATGVPFPERPDRYRVAIERLTVQDIAVFFQEALSALPQLVADLGEGGRVLDVHCGGGRWLIAMARRFPGLELVGVEFEPDSVTRAQDNVAAAELAHRITIEHGDVERPGHVGEFDLAYFQYALHLLPHPPAALAAAWAALRPGGRLLVLDWPLPSTVEEFRTRHGELIAGVQLDEILQGTRLVTREQFRAWFTTAGLPDPEVIDLPSGATLFAASQP
jgi:SAM-dependent methyltransferase